MSSVNTGCPKEISCPCTTFWIFLVHPSTCKNHNSHYINPIDMILDLLDSLESLFSSLQVLEFLITYFWSYEFLNVTYAICPYNKYKILVGITSGL